MSQLDDILSQNHTQTSDGEISMTWNSKEMQKDSKQQIKDLILELLKDSAKEAYSGSQHVEIFEKKVSEL